MKFLSQVLTAVSGSIGGITYSRGRGGGMYQRARATPTNPSTAPQLRAREAFGTMSTRWRDTLTQDQRDGWQAFADVATWTDALGSSIKLTALNWYQRCNALREQLGEAPVDDAPGSTDTLAPPDVTSLTITAPATFEGEAGAPGAGNLLAWFAGRPVNASVQFYKGPFSLLGSSTASTFSGSLAFPTPAGQKVFARVVQLNADGRVSQETVEAAVAS